MKFVISVKDLQQSQEYRCESVEISTHNSGTSVPKDPQLQQIMVPQATFEPDRKRQKVKSDITNMTTIESNLDVFGAVKAQAFYQFSDLRLKTNVMDIVDAIDIVTRLQGKRYEWKDQQNENTASGGPRVIGLIAQEVQKVLPEVSFPALQIRCNIKKNKKITDC